MSQPLNENVVIAEDSGSHLYIYFTNSRTKVLTFTISKKDGTGSKDITMDLCGWAYITHNGLTTKVYRSTPCLNYPGLFSTYTITGYDSDIFISGFKIKTIIDSTTYEFISDDNPFSALNINEQLNIGQNETVAKIWNNTSNNIIFNTLYDELYENVVCAKTLFNFNYYDILSFTNSDTIQHTFTVMNNIYETSSARTEITITNLGSFYWAYIASTGFLSARTNTYTNGYQYVSNSTLINVLRYSSVQDTLKILRDDNKIFQYYLPYDGITNGKQINIGFCLGIQAWDGTSNNLNFTLICLVETSLIRITKDNKYKEIQELKRGDLIYTSKGYLPISRVSKQLIFDDTILICIPKNTFDINIPFEDIICNEHHIFNINDMRYTAKALLNMNKAMLLDRDERYKYKYLYNLQFDEEITYIVQGLISEAVSPYYVNLYLPKELYHDKRKYKEGIKVKEDTYRALIYKDKTLITH